MQEGLTAVIATLLLYFSSLLGGGGSFAPPTSSLNPSWEAPAPSLDDSRGGTAVVTGNTVNLRSGPGNSYPLITNVIGGTQVTILAKSLGWVKVRTESGQVGWTPSWLISTDLQPGESLPGRVSPGPARKEIYGYYVENHSQDALSYRALQNYGKLLTGVIPFSYALTPQGWLRGDHSHNAALQAKNHSLKNLALVHNLSGSWFNSEVAHLVLTSPTRRALAVQSILTTVQRGGYSGVNLDLENIRPGDRAAYNAFIIELAAKLRSRGLELTVSVPAKTADFPGSLWYGAFDYAHLGRYADRVMLMTYDEHSRASGPGPIASIGWVEKVIRYASSQIPREKLVLGLAAYGYDWPRVGQATAVSYSQAMARLQKYRAELQWDVATKSPYFTYYKAGNRHTVWFENASSLAAKIELVNRYGLRGVALWRLGFEDPRFWQLIRDKLW